MNKIKVRIIKDKSINLKINSEVFEQIKKVAIMNGHFIADYINLVLFEHLKKLEPKAGVQIKNASEQSVKK